MKLQQCNPLNVWIRVGVSNELVGDLVTNPVPRPV